MKQKRVFLMCGPSGSGKSTYIQKRIAIHGGNWISRDLIRLSLVEENEPYFSKEDEVLRRFYATIDECLRSEMLHTDVYIDATHLSPKARKTVLNKLNKDYIKEIIAVSFEIPTAVAVSRNENRTGRADVPMTVIRDMNGRFIPPILLEGFNAIIHINENGEERREERNE